MWLTLSSNTFRLASQLYRQIGDLMYAASRQSFADLDKSENRDEKNFAASLGASRRRAC